MECVQGPGYLCGSPGAFQGRQLPPLLCYTHPSPGGTFCDPTKVPPPPFPVSPCVFQQEESSEHCLLNRSLYVLGLCPRRDLSENGDRKVGTEGRDLCSAPCPPETHTSLRQATVLSQETCPSPPPPSLGQQVKLKQVIPVTEEEKTEHGVAAERRRMRLVYADTIKDLLAHCAIQDGECGYTHKRAAGVLKPPLSGKRKGSPMDLCPW